MLLLFQNKTISEEQNELGNGNFLSIKHKKKEKPKLASLFFII